MDKPVDPIQHILPDFKAAVFDKDVERFVSLYDQDLRVFDMWGVWSYNGIASWREMTEAWFGSLGTERVVVDFSDVQTSVDQDLGVIHAFMKYKAVNAEGAELRSMDNRLTMTLRRNDSGWKIFHQHTSTPIDRGTVQVMFKR